MSEFVSMRPFHIRSSKNDYEKRVDITSKIRFSMLLVPISWALAVCYLATLCRRVASDSLRQPWQLLSIPFYPWRTYCLMLLMVAPLEYPMSVSSHLCLRLPLLLAPFILPSITSSSIPPALNTYPK